MKNPNILLQTEKAIIEKYGEAAVKDPRQYWSTDKEKNYLQELKDFYKDSFRDEKLLIEDKKNNSCNICNKYCFDKNDGIYLIKFRCCFKCYIEKIEGRKNGFN